jgi:hypothetical protein
MISEGKHVAYRPCPTLFDQRLTLLDGIMSSTTEMDDIDKSLPCGDLVKDMQGSVMIKHFNARLNNDHITTLNIRNIYTYIQGRWVHNTTKVGINYGQSLPREAAEWSRCKTCQEALRN